MSIQSSGSGFDTTFTAYKVSLAAISKWPAANFTNPQRRRWLTPYIIVLQVLSTLIVGTRVWTRLSKRAGGFGLHDGLIILSTLLAGCVTGIVVYGVHGAGLDRHVWDLHPAECAKTGLLAWAVELLFLSSLCATKISVALFFRLLIHRSNSRGTIRAIWAFILFTIAYFLAFALVLVFACNPVSAAWRSLDITWTGQYTCLDRKLLDPLNGVFSILSDLYCLAIPIIIIARLSVPFNRKIVLYLVFCCSIIVVGAGIARTIWLSRMYTDPKRDVTWVGYDLLVWGSLEIHLAIICASVPAIKGFLTGLSGSVTNHYNSRPGGSNSSKHYRTPPASGSGLLIDKSSTFSGGNQSSHSPIPLELTDKWQDNREHWATNTSSHDLLSMPQNGKVKDGGIWITETMTITHSHDPYYKERKILGI